MGHILLVNPFASARYLSSRFKECGVLTTALYTVDLAKMPSYLTPSNGMFDEQIKFQSSDVNKILHRLGTIKFDYVINGFESSLELSDILAQEFATGYANDPTTFLLRSDKYEMHRALMRNGLSYIQQMLYNLNDIIPSGITYPCFVKPLASSASIGANKIVDSSALETYFLDAQKYRNPWQNMQNKDRFLIAEYVEGIELIVDTFSLNGEHYISTIQRYHKVDHNGRPIYCYFELEHNETILKLVEGYIKKVLDATDYKNGFAHTELFLLPNNDIKLIEINPRISGCSGMINKMTFLSTGLDQIGLLMKYVFNQPQPSGDGKNYRCLVLFNLSGKPLYNLKMHLRKYKTVCEVLQIVPDGHITRDLKNVTLVDASALVLLCSDKLEKIEKETEEILIEDRNGWD